MKTTLFATLMLCTIASCSFVKDVQNHCTVSKAEGQLSTGSFETCLKCDSLSTVVKNQIAKASKK